MKRLVERAGAARFHRQHDPEFRTWIHEVQDLLKRVQKDGYSRASRVHSLLFRPTYPTTNQGELNAAFETDLEITLLELKTAIKHFAEYGQPSYLDGMRKAFQEPPTPAPTNAPIVPHAEAVKAPVFPERWTLRLLFDHVTLAQWVGIGTTMAAIFSAGVFVGRSSLFLDQSPASKTVAPQAEPLLPKSPTAGASR